MAFSAKSPLQRLKTILSGLTGVQAAYEGVPESLPYAVSAYVTLGGQDPKDIAGGLRSRWANYRVTFAYRVGGAELTAEEALADILDLFEAALYADRTLAGTVESLEADWSGADEPRYVPVVGVEYREFPVMVKVKQQRNYP